jgi:hypothetical protein
MCAALVPVPPTMVAPAVASGLPLEAARAAFGWLGRGPRPVAVDGRRLAGLPRRPIPVDELADRLADPRVPARVRDAVWAHLVRRSRAEGATWTVVCAGLAAPALEQISHRLCAPRSGPTTTPRRRSRHSLLAAARVEVEAAVLAGFLAELATVELRRPGIAARLTDAGFEAGRTALREIRTAPRPRAALFTSTPPPAPARHPDLVLARAVADRALTHQEAVLIGATRLEPLRLADLARTRRQSVAQTRAARIRAERKLSAYLRDPDRIPHTPTDLDTDEPDRADGDRRDARRSPHPDRRQRRSTTSRRDGAVGQPRPHRGAADAQPAAAAAEPVRPSRHSRPGGAGGNELGAGEPHRHTLRRHRRRGARPHQRAGTGQPIERRS